MSIELLQRALRAVSQIPNETRLTRQLADLIKRETRDRNGEPYYVPGEEVVARRVSKGTGRVMIDFGKVELVRPQLDGTFLYDIRIAKDKIDYGQLQSLDRHQLILKDFVV